MRRSVLLLTTILFSLATAAALTIAAATMARPDVRPTSTHANTDVVRRFYAAVNKTIATGATDALDEVIAADFVEREPLPGLPPDRDGLRRHLIALHETSPTLRLEVMAITAEGDRVMTRLHIRQAEATAFLGMPVDGYAAPWGHGDLFRIAGGRIAERWAASAGTGALRPWHTAVAEVGTPPGRLIVVHRQTVPPNDLFVSPLSTSILLAVEAGRLAVVVDAASPSSPVIARKAQNDIARPETRIDPGGTVEAVAGDLLIVPDGAIYRARNNGDEPAVILTLDLAEPETFDYTGLHPARMAGETTEATMLGGALFADLAAGSYVISIGQAALAPGAVLTFRDPPGPLFLVIDSGTIDITNSSDVALVGNGHDGISNVVDGARLATGDGASLPAGSLTSVGNAGAEPATMVIIFLMPTVVDPPSPHS